jgi:hypothetical protein
MPAPRRRSLADRKRRWHFLIANSQEILAEMPYLEADLQALKTVDKEITSLIAQQAQYLAKCREITSKIRKLSKAGDHVRGKIGSSLRGRHGYAGTELIKFGFKPRRNRRDLEDVELTVGASPAAEEPSEEKGNAS